MHCSTPVLSSTPLTYRWRGFNPRKVLKQQKNAATMVQRSFKIGQNRQHFHSAFVECVEAARKQKQMKYLLHALSSDRVGDKDQLLDECQILISYLGEQLYIQRVKTSETKDELECTKQRLGSLLSRIDTLEAEGDANRIMASRQREKSLVLEENLKDQKHASANLIKSIVLLQQEQSSAIENREEEISNMRNLYQSKSEEFKRDLANTRKEHATEVSRLQDLIKLANEKHQREISDFQRKLEETEELHEEDFEKMLTVVDEHASKQEELQSKKESLQKEIKNLNSELQSSRKAHVREVTTLNEKLDMLQDNTTSKDGEIDSLKSQIKSIQEEHSVVISNYEKEGSEMRDLLSSQKDELYKELSHVWALHAKETEKFEAERRSLKKAHLEEVDVLNKELDSLREELSVLKNKLDSLQGNTNSKDVMINSLQSQIKSLQEKHTVIITKHKKECSEMCDLFASQKDELFMELSNARDMHASDVEMIDAELRCSKKAHLEEVTTLNDDLDKLQDDINSKEGKIDSLQCQIKSLHQENTATIAKYEKEHSEMHDLFASQKDKLTMKLSSVREVHAADVKMIEEELRSSKEAHLEEVAGLNNNMEKLLAEVMSKDGTINSLQSRIKSLQEDQSIHQREISDLERALGEAKNLHKDDCRKIQLMMEENAQRQRMRDAIQDSMESMRQSISGGSEYIKAELNAVKEDMAAVKYSLEAQSNDSETNSKSRGLDFGMIAPDNGKRVRGKTMVWRLILITALISFTFFQFRDGSLAKEDKISKEKKEVMELNITPTEAMPSIEELKQNDSKQEETMQMGTMYVAKPGASEGISNYHTKAKTTTTDVFIFGKELLTCPLKDDPSKKKSDAAKHLKSAIGKLSICNRKLDAFADTDSKLSEYYAEVKGFLSEMKDLHKSSADCDKALVSCQAGIVQIEQNLLTRQIDTDHALFKKDEQLVSMTEVVSTCNMNLNAVLISNKVLEEKFWNCSTTSAKLESDRRSIVETHEVEAVKDDLFVCQNNLDKTQKDNATCGEKLLRCCDNELGDMDDKKNAGSGIPYRSQKNSIRKLKRIIDQEDAKPIVAGITVAFIAPHLSSLLGVLFSPSAVLVANPVTLKAVRKSVDIKKMAANIAWKANDFFAQTWIGGVH
uniref:Uncharacterized protein n=1 Tax=Ditylum brightwellii TaxID=49249 RepID=A0A6V2KEP9_9STRA